MSETPSRSFMNESTLVQELSTNPRYSHALYHVNGPDDQGKLIGKVKGTDQRIMPIARAGSRWYAVVFRDTDKTFEFNDTESMNACNFKGKVGGFYLADESFVIKFIYNDRVSSSEKGAHTIYTIILPAAKDLELRLQQVRKTPRLVIEVQTQVYPSEDRSVKVMASGGKLASYAQTALGLHTNTFMDVKNPKLISEAPEFMRLCRVGDLGQLVTKRHENSLEILRRRRSDYETLSKEYDELDRAHKELKEQIRDANDTLADRTESIREAQERYDSLIARLERLKTDIPRFFKEGTK